MTLNDNNPPSTSGDNPGTMGFSLFPQLYLPDDRDRKVFGKLYTPPERFNHAEWHQVAHIAEDSDSDGQSCSIDEMRIPARFFRLRVHESGEKKSFTFETGSGYEMATLVFQMATAISEGMLELVHH